MARWSPTSSSDASESERSSTGDSDENEGRGAVDLNLSHLKALQPLAGDQEGVFSQNGSDPARVREVLKKGACKCKAKCANLVPFKSALAICKLFWGLPKPAQDSLLWGLQNTEEKEEEESDESSSAASQRPCRKKWHLAGHQICRMSWMRIMGVSSKRLARTRARAHGLDERTLKGQKANTRPAEATAGVTIFMQKMYCFRVHANGVLLVALRCNLF